MSVFVNVCVCVSVYMNVCDCGLVSVCVCELRALIIKANILIIRDRTDCKSFIMFSTFRVEYTVFNYKCSSTNCN